MCACERARARERESAQSRPQGLEVIEDRGDEQAFVPSTEIHRVHSISQERERARGSSCYGQLPTL